MAKKSTQNPTKRSSRDVRRKQEQNKKFLTYGGIGLLVAALIGMIVFLATRPAPVEAAVGDAVPVASAEHVPIGTNPGPYPTNPPAGGKHYPAEADPKFYEEADAAGMPKYQEGYLVHNLEHGYIIFWYNCNANTQVDCSALKSDIRKVMAEFNGVKMIAFPWPSQKEPLVLTSWGRILRLDGSDLEKMRAFYRANLNKSPEPNAQ